MSVYNRTEREIEGLRRAVAEGRKSKEAAEAAIAKLQKRGDVWIAEWYLPNGKPRIKSFAVAKFGKKAKKMAEEIESLRRNQVKLREFSDPLTLRTTVKEVLAYYLANKMHRNGEPRASFKNARAQARDIVEIWGERLTLEKLDRDPDDLLDILRDGLTLMHGDAKTEWNRKVTLSAAINYFKDKKRLRVLNPLIGYDWPQPKSKREECPTWEDLQAILVEARKPRHQEWPWLPYLIRLGWEHALRMGEFLSWRWEWITLDPEGDDLPWVRTRLLKQNGEEEWREVPLFPEAVQALRDMPAAQKEHGPVFQPARSTVDKAWRRVYDDAGREHLTFHDFRRALDRRYPGLSQRQRMELLGQKTEKANESYRLRMERKQMEALIRPSYLKMGLLPDARQNPDTDSEDGEI